MIDKAGRGWNVGRLLRYLMGPGHANEHTDPRVVASWDGRPELLGPPAREAKGKKGVAYDVRELTARLNAPAVAGRVGLVRPEGADTERGPVWHCSLRNHEKDRELTDAEWAAVAADVMHRTGIAPRGDRGACRWVAVRHASDHIHLAAILVREDTGKRVIPWQYKRRAREACEAAEVRFDLVRTAPEDRTATVASTRAEVEKAEARRETERKANPEGTRVERSNLRDGDTPRAWLRRMVRAAAIAAHDLDSFDAALADRGVVLEFRRHPETREPVGVLFGAPGDENAQGDQVWFSGSRLAPDLSLPKLRARWANSPVKPVKTTGTGARMRVSIDGIAEVVEDTVAAVRAAEDTLRAARAGGQSDGEREAEPAEGIVHAAEDILIAVAGATSTHPKGWPDPGGIEDVYERAARQAGVGQPQRWGEVAAELRSCARALLAVGRRVQTGGPDGSGAALLLAVMALLAEIAAWHEQAQHIHQHAAVKTTRELLERRPAARADRASGPPGRGRDARRPEPTRTRTGTPTPAPAGQPRTAPPRAPQPPPRPPTPGFGPGGGLGRGSPRR